MHQWSLVLMAKEKDSTFLVNCFSQCVNIDVFSLNFTKVKDSVSSKNY